MSEKTFKPLTVEDFDLSPEDMKIIVEGAQKFLPPVEVDTEPKMETS
jgi:hypothetical protein